MKVNIEKDIHSAKKASQSLLHLSEKDRKDVLLGVAVNIKKRRNDIIKENAKDVKYALLDNKTESFIERLQLNEKDINSICKAVRQIACSEDNLFKIISKSTQNSGITIQKKRFPLGVVAIIYESRPNVTMDAFAIAFKSGNAIVLKGGKESVHTNKIFTTIIKNVLNEYHIDERVIWDFSRIGREDVIKLIENDNIDCLIPRGGKCLIEYVKNNAKVPIIITGASVVHIYIDADADLQKAVDVVVNSKLRRVSVCNALDTILIHDGISEKFLSLFVKSVNSLSLLEIRADSRSFGVLQKMQYKNLKKVTKEDFDTEFLDNILAVRVVDSLKDAIVHIQKHSLGHSEGIVTENANKAEEFFQKIDSACLYLNTSTQFSDGGEFGMGGEIGISTQKLHARGPFAFVELTTYKYIVESEGLIRG
jgi:glutamate-5-semialdehyde dehydrogenase